MAAPRRSTYILIVQPPQHRVLARFDFAPGARALRDAFVAALVGENWSRTPEEEKLVCTLSAPSADLAKGMAMQSIQRARIAAEVPLGAVSVVDVRVTRA